MTAETEANDAREVFVQDIAEQLRVEADYRKDEMDPTLMPRAAAEIDLLRAAIKAISQQAAGGAPAGYYWSLTKEVDQ